MLRTTALFGDILVRFLLYDVVTRSVYNPCTVGGGIPALIFCSLSSRSFVRRICVPLVVGVAFSSSSLLSSSSSSSSLSQFPPNRCRFSLMVPNISILRFRVILSSFSLVFPFVVAFAFVPHPCRDLSVRIACFFFVGASFVTVLCLLTSAFLSLASSSRTTFGDSVVDLLGDSFYSFSYHGDPSFSV